MKKVLINLLLISGFLLSSVLIAEDVRQLSLSQFIAKSSQNSYLKEILTDELTLKYSNILNSPADELLMTALIEHSVNPDLDISPETAADLSLTKTFGYTGTEVSLGYSSKSGENSSLSPPNIKIEQDIIKNSLGKTARKEAEIADLENKAAKLQIIEIYEDYLASLINLYFRWYSAYETVQLSRKSFEDSQKVLENTREKLKYQIALPVDINKSKLQMESKREQLIKNEKEHAIIYRQIQAALNTSKNRQFIPIIDFTYDMDKLKYSEIIESVMTNSRTKQLMHILKENSSLKIDISLDQMLPEGSIFSKYTLADNSPAAINENAFSAGFSFSWYIDNDKLQAVYELNKLEEKKQELSNINDTRDLLKNLDILYLEISSIQKLIALTEEKIELSRMITEEEEKDYEQGRTSLDDLLEKYNALDNNRHQKINYQIQFMMLYLELLQTADLLIDDNKTLSDRSNKL